MSTLARAGAVVGAVALATGLAAAPAAASTPESSTLTAPKGTGSVITAWDGTVDYPGLLFAPAVGAYDTHDLTVQIPGKKPAKYFKKRDATVSIEISWEGTGDDLDLYVYDAAGNELGSSIAGDGVELVTVPVTGPAEYLVQVESFLARPGIAYDAQATLTVTPKVG